MSRPGTPSFRLLSRARLAAALAVSLLLHVVPLLERPPTPPAQPAPAPALRAKLRAPAAPEGLRLPEPPPNAGRQAPPPPAPRSASPAARSAAAPSNWQAAIRRQFERQRQRGQFYPAEAIARGLEGEALVLVLLSADGEVAAARIEQSSGQPLLDEAALRAVRALRGLPADAPREALLPVRFRLR